MGNGVFDNEADAHCCYIIVEFSSRPGGIGGDRGVPRDRMRQLAGITDMQRGGQIYTVVCQIYSARMYIFGNVCILKTNRYI